jgi:hypothetical protein
MDRMQENNKEKKRKEKLRVKTHCLKDTIIVRAKRKTEMNNAFVLINKSMLSFDNNKRKERRNLLVGSTFVLILYASKDGKREFSGEILSNPNIHLYRPLNAHDPLTRLSAFF